MCSLSDFESEASKWTLKFPRKYGAERIKGLPSMRGLFEELYKQNGIPPSPDSFSQGVWDGCTNVKSTLEEDVKARARRAHPSFVREAHFQLVLTDRLHGVAEVLSNVELDMKNKTDFLVTSLTAPIQVRIHTFTNTARGNRFAEMRKKQPVSTSQYSPKSGMEDILIVDMKVTIAKGEGTELDNGLWLYDSGHADEVFDTLHEIHVAEGFAF
tara:strand:- start:567 stop:1205 length:639 start_codon:yes stop_codon:yes gene_type:complete